MSVFPDVGSYAFLSDCETNALVAPGGQVEWLCVPRPDSASIFGALLDRSAGLFGFGPGGVEVPSQRRYIPGTMVLETTWHTPTGWLVVTDALVVGPWRGGSRSDRYLRVPSDRVAQGVLVRTATCIDGRADVLPEGPGTGTTVTRGCAIPRSCCGRCCAWASIGRPTNTSPS